MNPIDYLRDAMMIPIITFFHDYVPPHNWGLAIVLLTITVKLILYPLTARQFSNMRVMQKLQPMLKELQEKYKGDPQQLQLKMMELYKDHNTTPFGGCLPILIQIPVLFALYASLTAPAMIETLHQAPPYEKSFLFIRDLLANGVVEKFLEGPWMSPASVTVYHWDNLVLIALFTLTSYLSQRIMTTNPDDPMQRQMLIMAPLMGPMIGWVLPSGVLLYIVVSSIFTIGQYAVLLKQFPMDAAPAAATPATAGGSGKPVKTLEAQPKAPEKAKAAATPVPTTQTRDGTPKAGNNGEMPQLSREARRRANRRHKR
ncbi:MAG: membrane protein insertase YidC [Candidatus Sericytochromatia bacterium]|uniref:Membrane protein insertase YidC n=1 Tax=Candidatus Tanganyikabacteria bacterium TaxID=2961651 RepID=A0A937X523_9BACT|nr:membrane protein insertase YidC [Candidatus Tanganyikabacteria bacterium]